MYDIVCCGILYILGVVALYQIGMLMLLKGIDEDWEDPYGGTRERLEKVAGDWIPGVGRWDE